MSIRNKFSSSTIGSALACAVMIAAPAHADLLGSGAVGAVRGMAGGSMGVGQISGGVGGAFTGSAIRRHVDSGANAAARGDASGSTAGSLSARRLIDATDSTAANRAQLTGQAQGAAGAAASAGDQLRSRAETVGQRAASTDLSVNKQAGVQAQADQSGAAANGGGSAEAGNRGPASRLDGSAEASVRR